MEREDTDPYHRFKFYNKGQVLEYWKECIIVNRYVCRRLKNNDLYLDGFGRSNMCFNRMVLIQVI